MTLLTFKDKYVISSQVAVTTTLATLVDDTEASQTFTLAASQVVLAIYQANNVHGALMPLTGMQNAINVDTVDKANSWDSIGAVNRATRNCVFWLGTLAAGSHTIKGRFASRTAASTATISNRVLLIYIFDGNEFQYLDDTTVATAPDTTMIDDPYAQVTFTPSGACKALIMYHCSNSGATESVYGKKAAINVAGIDYGQAEKSAHAANDVDSVFTVHALSLSAVSTTVKGRFANAGTAATVTIHRRQLAVLLLADSTLMDVVTATVQVSTTSNVLADDAQALISRTTTDVRELLVVAMGTRRSGTAAGFYGECYGIKINVNDRTNSRGSAAGTSYADSVATAQAEQLAAGSHTVQGRFSNNSGTDSAKIDARQVVALWFSSAAAPTYVNVSDSGVGADSLYDLSATFTIADSGGSSDVAGMQAGLPLDDFGVGSDALQSISLFLTDAGSGVDEPTLQGALTLTDIGSAVESLIISTNIVGTSTSNAATRECTQRKSFCANGKFWVFYTDGTNMIYKTSTDGFVWSSATIVRSCIAGYFFTVFFDGTYVHYVFHEGYYRRGTPNADGTITWSAAEQTIGTWCDWPVLSVDSSGYVWLGFSKVIVNNPLPFVTKSGNNDGTWGTPPPGFPHQLSTIESVSWDIVPVSLTNNKMVIFYGKNGTTLNAKPWDGSSWGAVITTTSSLGWGGEHSAVPEGDAADVVFLTTAYDIIYVKYTYSSNSFGAEITLQAGATSSSAPVISVDAPTNDLYVFWAGYPTANHFFYRKYTVSTSTWETAVDWIPETNLTSNGYHNCFYKANESKIGLAYMTETASPYTVKFSYLTVATLNYIYVSDSGLGADVLYNLSATLTLTESGSGTDGLNMQASLPLSDSGVGLDGLQSIELPLTDVGFGVDALDMQSQLSSFDSGSGTDSSSLQGQISLGDLGSGADASLLEASLPLSDSGVGADVLQSIALPLADVGSGTDVLNVQGQLPLSDVGSGLDSASMQGSLTLSDVGAGYDLSSLQAQLSLADSGVGADVLESIGLSILDSGIGADVPSMLGQLSLGDSGLGTEYVSAGFYVGVSDSGSGIETLSMLGQLALADSAVAVDILSELQAQLPIGDSGLGTEVLQSIGLPLSDSGSGLDVPSLQGQLQLGDAGVGTDVLSQLQAQLPISEAGLGSELFGLQGSLTLADVGNGVDSPSLLAQLSLADSALGSDLLSLLTQVLLSDSGLGAESIGIDTGEIIKAFLDSGLGAEAVSLLAQLLLAESSIGSEGFQLQGSLSISDSGLGTEIVCALPGYIIRITAASFDRIKITEEELGKINITSTFFDRITIIEEERN